MTEIFDHRQWAALPLEEAARITRDLSIPDRFSFVEIRQYRSGVPIATFQDVSSGLNFNLIPGGEYSKGLSRAEREAASRIPGCRMDVLDSLAAPETVSVEPFFITQTPLQQAFVSQHVELSDLLFRPEFADDPDDPAPIYMAREELQPLLDEFRMSIPNEAQMEFALRGGTQSLFWFGSTLPDEETLGSDILVSVFHEETLSDVAKANPFGLYGSLVGCWCSDVLAGAGPGSPSRPGHVIKGGAAIFWPWQGGSEWMLCMSSMRMSSQDLEDETCAAFTIVPYSGE